MYLKGIAIFIAVAFGLGWLCQILALWSGAMVFQDSDLLRTIPAVLIMMIPGLAALAARKFAPDDASDESLVWPLPMGTAVRMAIMVPLVFVLSWIISAIAQFSSLDWEMGSLREAILKTGVVQEMTREMSATLPMLALTAGTILLILLGATLFAAIALVHEAGWRGYLLPRLLARLNKWMAYVILGFLWVLWFLPMMYTFYKQYRSEAEAFTDPFYFLAMSIAFGAFLGEIWRRTRHLGLVAIALGCFTAEINWGLMKYLFITGDNTWAGPFGVISIVLWAIAALFPQIFLGRQRDKAIEQTAARKPTFSN